MPLVSAIETTVTFEEYEKTYYMEGDSLRVEKDIVMVNRLRSPVVPGSVEFRMYEIRGRDIVPSQISEVYARDNSRELDTRVETHGDHTKLIVMVRTPLMQDYEFPVSISYEIDFNPSGILFHEVLFPIEETTNTVVDSTTRLVMPNRYRVTYAPDAEIEKDGMRQSIEWGGGTEIMLEYTRLPLPQMPFRMVSVFWLTILLILGVIFIYLNSRRPDSPSKKKR